MTESPESGIVLLCSLLEPEKFFFSAALPLSVNSGQTTPHQFGANILVFYLHKG